MSINIGRYQILFYDPRWHHPWRYRFGYIWPGGKRDPNEICSYRSWQIGPLEVRRWFLTDAEAKERE